jgi:hypothetical protein
MSKPTKFRVTLIWPPYAAVSFKANEDGSKSKVCREVFPNCTDVENIDGRLQFRDARGKLHLVRMSFEATEE